MAPATRLEKQIKLSDRQQSIHHLEHGFGVVCVVKAAPGEVEQENDVPVPPLLAREALNLLGSLLPAVSVVRSERGF